jgi:hypothetical protein
MVLAYSSNLKKNEMNGIPFIISLEQVSYLLYFVAVGRKKTTIEIHLQGKNHLLELDPMGMWIETDPDAECALNQALIDKVVRVFKCNFQ